MVSLEKKKQQNKEIEKANLEMVLDIVEQNDRLKVLNMVKNIIISLLVGYIAIPYLIPDTLEVFLDKSFFKEAWSLTIDTMEYMLVGFIPVLAFVTICLIVVPMLGRLFR